MPSSSRKRQVSALPVKGKPGAYLVLLITSRETQRWIIPKGWPMRGRKAYHAAAQTWSSASKPVRKLAGIKTIGRG